MQGGKLVALTYTALTITLTTDPAKAGVAQFLPFETATLKRITVLADTVTILERIDLNGIDLRIVARELRCAEGYAQCVINTSGRQNEASLKANSKQAQSGSRGNGFGGPGGKGADGRWIACQNGDAVPLLGISGQDGGSIDIAAWTSAPNLVFNARGGDGTPGQVGGDGGDGEVGETYPRHAEVAPETGSGGARRCKGKYYINEEKTIINDGSGTWDSAIRLYAWKGNPGKPGGNGGDAGAEANWVG